MDLKMNGKVALVTGAATGIGAAIAEGLAREGCMVWVADRDGDGAAGAAERLVAVGLEARSITVDVTQAAAVRAAFERVGRESGHLDVLVSNAGILKTGAFRDASAADWDGVLAVNLSGVVACAREAAEMMVAQGGGRIVNIASISAMRGGGSLGNVLYGTSKAGVVALTMGLARELGPSGITVNAVAPAVADTPMTRASLTPEALERIVSRVPLRRLASPADIADAVVFLASARAGFITGVVLPVNGGILTT